MPTNKLLFDELVEGCGHRVQMWIEQLDDGSDTLHFAAPCPKCQELAVIAAQRAVPGIQISFPH